MADESRDSSGDPPQELQFEIVDDGESAPPQSAEEPLSPEAVRRAFDVLARGRVLKSLLRTLVIGGVLGLLSVDQTWARRVLIIYLVFAAVSLTRTIKIWLKVRKDPVMLELLLRSGAGWPPFGCLSILGGLARR